MSDPADALPRWLLVGGAAAWRLLAIAGAVVVGGFALARLHLVVLPVLVAVITAALAAPPTGWLDERGWPRGLAAAAVVVGGLALLGGVIALLATRFAGQLDELGRLLPEARAGLADLLRGLPGLSQAPIGDLLEQGAQQLRENADRIVSGVVSGTVLVLEVVGGALLAVVLVFFLVRDGPELRDWALGLVGEDRRERVATVARDAWRVLGRYVRGVVIIAAVDALGISLGLLLLGVPLVGALGALIFLAGFVPIIGASVTGLLAVAVAAVDGGLATGLLALAVVVAVQQVDAHVLQPVIMGHEVPLHPVVILLVVASGGILYGIPGAALAVPVAAVATSVGGALRDDVVVGTGTGSRPGGQAGAP